MAIKRQEKTNRIVVLLMAIGVSGILAACGGKSKVDSGVAIRPNGGVIAGGTANIAPGQDGKAEGSSDNKKDSEKEKVIKNICILYTGDVHGSIANAGKGDFYYDEENLTYSSLTGYKYELQSQSNAVFMVDAGDCLYGSDYAAKDEGMAIVNLMNEAGYNVAVPGDQDFMYGMDRFLKLSEQSQATYISCNLYSKENGVGLLPSYCILESGGVKVAFVGVTTPDAVDEKSKSYEAFLNEDGEKAYDILYSEEGDKLYSAVQKAVNAARDQADYVVVISHLGCQVSEDMTARPEPLTSKAVIMSTKGIDVFIDAHAGNEIESELVPNMAGETVVLTSAGKNLDAFGEVKISKSGKISAKLIKDYDYRADKVYELEKEYIGE